MRGVTYAMLGPPDAAAALAKKGTETDVTLYHAKHGDDHLNLVSPSRYPERLGGLLAALDLADRIVLHVAQVDRALGECIVGAELFGKTQGFLRIGPTADADQVTTLLARTALSGLERVDGPDGVLRERLYGHAWASEEGSLVLPVDHAFPVKGVGTVALGLVRRGVVEAHQKLQAYPTEDSLEVRSLQVHDVDRKRAPAGSRVGLAVKGIEADRLPRGRVLAPPGSLGVLEAGAEVDLPVAFHPFNKWMRRAGTVLHVYHVLQDVVVRIHAADGDRLRGRLEAPLAVVPGQPAVLVDLDNKAQRFVGRIELGG